MRYLFAVKNFWHYRQQLKQYVRLEPEGYGLAQQYNIQKITQLSDLYLKNQQIKALVLDFDGVLNSHGENTIDARVVLWLKAMHLSMPSLRLFILSNRPNILRQQYFATHFPYITFISNIRKKPYPDGLAAVWQIISSEYTKQNSSDSSVNGDTKANDTKVTELLPTKTQILLVDDRLATGILAALIFGCQALFVTKPLVKYRKHCIQECFFKILRTLEKAAINLVK